MLSFFFLVLICGSCQLVSAGLTHSLLINGVISSDPTPQQLEGILSPSSIKDPNDIPIVATFAVESFKESISDNNGVYLVYHVSSEDNSDLTLTVLSHNDDSYYNVAFLEEVEGKGVIDVEVTDPLKHAINNEKDTVQIRIGTPKGRLSMWTETAEEEYLRPYFIIVPLNHCTFMENDRMMKAC